jgi:hypothetical protein
LGPSNSKAVSHAPTLDSSLATTINQIPGPTLASFLPIFAPRIFFGLSALKTADLATKLLTKFGNIQSLANASSQVRDVCCVLSS